jgi:phosphotransferase system enzyme I (PtsP)
LREIVKKVAAAARLIVALDILVDKTCLAMDTEVCSIYLADKQPSMLLPDNEKLLIKTTWACYISLAFNEGNEDVVGLSWELLEEPIHLAYM